MIVKLLLVVDAAGNARIGKRPRVGSNEVAFRVNVTIPDQWGTILRDQIDITVPPPPTAKAVG